MKLRRAISAISVSTFALSGCSTSYAPKPHPRVAVVMQGGTPVYIREGRVFPGGGFGGDLREAVQGNSEAERYAKSYRTNMIAGVTTALGGVASAIGGGILYAASSSGPDNERSGTQEAIGGTMVVGGIAAYITGMVLMLNAQPHLWDAINAYNDGVDPGSAMRVGPSLATAPNGPYAPYATAGSPPYGAIPAALPSLPSETASASTKAAAKSAAPAPPAATPPAASGSGSNDTTSSEPGLDLDLDTLEAQ